MIFALVLVEDQRVAGNFHRQVYLGDVRPRIKERRLQRTVNRSGLIPGRLQLHLFFDRFPIERTRGPYVAIAAARTDVHPAVVHFHFQRVAAALWTRRRNVAQQIKFILVFFEEPESTEKVVGVVNRKSTRSISERLEYL